MYERGISSISAALKIFPARCTIRTAFKIFWHARLLSALHSRPSRLVGQDLRCTPGHYRHCTQDLRGTALKTFAALRSRPSRHARLLSALRSRPSRHGAQDLRATASYYRRCTEDLHGTPSYYRRCAQASITSITNFYTFYSFRSFYDLNTFTSSSSESQAETKQYEGHSIMPLYREKMIELLHF